MSLCITKIYLNMNLMKLKERVESILTLMMQQGCPVVTSVYKEQRQEFTKTAVQLIAGCFRS